MNNAIITEIQQDKQNMKVKIPTNSYLMEV